MVGPFLRHFAGVDTFESDQEIQGPTVQHLRQAKKVDDVALT